MSRRMMHQYEEMASLLLVWRAESFTINNIQHFLIVATTLRKSRLDDTRRWNNHRKLMTAESQLHV